MRAGGELPEGVLLGFDTGPGGILHRFFVGGVALKPVSRHGDGAAGIS